MKSTGLGMGGSGSGCGISGSSSMTGIKRIRNRVVISDCCHHECGLDNHLISTGKSPLPSQLINLRTVPPQKVIDELIILSSLAMTLKLVWSVCPSALPFFHVFTFHVLTGLFNFF